MTNKNEDPFDCFGSSDDDDYYDEDQNQAREISKDFLKKRIRPLNCGVLSFHSKTETSLLLHVRNFLQKEEQQKLLGSDDNEGVASDLVCRAIDQYCEERHWMMHIGPEKGKILTDALHKCILEKKNCDNPQIDDFLCVELGTYCGYASILMASVLEKMSSMATISQNKSKLLTVEINQTFQKIATDLVGLAKLQNYVTFLSLDLNFDGTTQNVAKLLQKEINKMKGHENVGSQRKIDFLFIDHDKDLYLHDLNLLQNQGLIQPGTVVIADNVVFAQIDNYINYMKELSENGIVMTETIPAHVEYSSQKSKLQNESNMSLFQDGIEMTRYIKSPVGVDEMPLTC